MPATVGTPTRKCVYAMKLIQYSDKAVTFH